MLMVLALAAALTFPNVGARDLDGRTLQARQAIKEPVAVLIGFTYGQRAEVEAWARVLPEATSGKLRVVQLPVLTGVAGLARPMIEAGMARGRSKAERGDVWISTDRDALVRGLALENPDGAAALVLVDATGTVRLVVRGAPTPATRAEVEKAVEALAAD